MPPMKYWEIIADKLSSCRLDNGAIWFPLLHVSKCEREGRATSSGKSVRSGRGVQIGNLLRT
jgi:hypothetical protein